MRRVSILIPTYKEERIGETLSRLAEHLAGIEDATFELLVVDDSPEPFQDEIREWIRANEAAFPRLKAHLVPGERRGKGHAVKIGARASTGDVVFTIDADLPVPLQHIEEFLRILDQTGADIVLGERPLMRNVKSPMRFVLSRALLLFQRAVVFQSTQFADTQCGFKAFRGDVMRRLAARQTVDGGMYDIELLYIAVRDGAKVAHRPVEQNPEVRPSRINVWRCIYTDPRDLFRVKIHGLAGDYDGARD